MSQFLAGIVARLTTLFDPETLGEAAADLLANLVVGSVTFLLYFIAWKVLDLGARVLSRRVDFDRTNREFALT